MRYDDSQRKTRAAFMKWFRNLCRTGAVTRLCVIALTSLPSLSQTAPPHLPLSVGQLIESVACESDPTQTYALYLPSTYTPAKRWPIIYAFDPQALGSRPVELYKDIAEKYGFVLAGSNNSRNFSASESAKSVNAMWIDTHVRLTLDERRVYTTGFSGGARMAGSVALGCAQCKIAGVIAHGAGYPANRKSATKDALLYFFAIGNQDFNWPEVITLRREREEQGLPYRVRGFSGPHQWAPADVMQDAVEWMMLKAMQSGSQAPDAAFIDRFFLRMQAEGDDAQKRGDAIAQLNAYRSLTSDFSGFKDIAGYETKLATIKKSAFLKSALGKEHNQIADQELAQEEISPKLTRLADGNADDPAALGREIAQAMGRLHDQSEHAKTEENRLIAARAFRAVWAQGIEAGQMAFESRHFEKAEACFRLLSSVGDDIWPVLMLAETHAALGDKKQALKDLHEAVRRGLKDPGALAKDARLQSLSSEDDFQQLILQLSNAK
jgi:dienelactone hydrolase